MFPLANTLNPLGSVAAVASGGTPTYTEAITSISGSTTSSSSGDQYLGFRFTMNASKSAHSFSRIKISGNSAVHRVMLLDSGGILLACTDVDLSTGSAGSEVFSDLIADFSLVSGSTYYLLASEPSGGDSWYSDVGVTSTGDLTVNASAYTNFGTVSPHNNYTGLAGYKFTPSANQTVTQLGRMKVNPSDSGSHTVYILDASGNSLASVTINNSGQPTGFVYATLGSPLSLTGGTSYYAMTAESSGGDTFFDITNSSLASGLTLNNAAFGTLGSVTDYTSGQAWLVDFIFGSSQKAMTGFFGGGFHDFTSGANAFGYPNFKYS